MEQFFDFFGNHPALFGAFLLVLAAIIANEIHGNMTGAKKLSAPAAVRLINDRDPVILDVRPAADFKKGHLLNALSVPMQKLEQSLGLFDKDKAKPVIVYCALGGTSSLAALQLKKQGFSEVYPIAGGLNAWLTANLPVTAK